MASGRLSGVHAKVAGGTLPYVGTGTIGRVVVWTDEQDFDRAERLLFEWNLKRPDSGSKPRRFQFSLLAIFVAVTYVAVFFAPLLSVKNSETFQVVWGVIWSLFWFTICAVVLRRRYGRRTQHSQSPPPEPPARPDSSGESSLPAR